MRSCPTAVDTRARVHAHALTLKGGRETAATKGLVY